MIRYISTKEAAICWGISERRIQKLCQEQRIPGVQRFGQLWMIPSDAAKPHDARKKGVSKDFEQRTKMDLYGNELRVVSTNEKFTVYFIKNKTGTGRVTDYHVLPGIEIYYNDFHMLDGFTRKQIQTSDVIEINHCKQGRFECEFQAGGYAYLGEGDLAINMMTNSKDTAYFPLSRYQGMSIVIHIPEVNQTIHEIQNVLQDLQIDMNKIQNKLRLNQGYFIIRAADRIEHIFYELYHTPDTVKEGYLKVKILELFMFLSTTDIEHQPQKREYFPKHQVEKIKKMREFLISHLEEKYTLAQLSEKFLIPKTTMKKVFKGIYGAPILTYLREYRIQAAAQMLQNSSLSISEISDEVGYENPAKFSETFKNRMKYSPSAYRKKNCPVEESLNS